MDAAKWSLLALALIAAGAFFIAVVLAEIAHKLLRDEAVDEAKAAKRIKLGAEEQRVRDLAAKGEL